MSEEGARTLLNTHTGLTVGIFFHRKPLARGCLQGQHIANGFYGKSLASTHSNSAGIGVELWSALLATNGVASYVSRMMLPSAIQAVRVLTKTLEERIGNKARLQELANLHRRGSCVLLCRA